MSVHHAPVGRSHGDQPDLIATTIETTVGPTLACTDLRHAYDEFHLGPIDVELTSGVTCLVGPNGAGKSTLFRLLSGMERPRGGTVSITTPDATHGLGYLPQDPSLPPRATCRQFVEYAAWVQGVGRSRRSMATEAALAAVNLADRADSRIGTLSGGMVRRVGIAHALVHQPAVVLLDEPTAGLDPRQRVELRSTIGDIAGDRVVLVSTHLVEDVRGLADRVLVLDEGHLVFDGTVAALEQFDDPVAPGDTPLERAISVVLDGGR